MTQVQVPRNPFREPKPKKAPLTFGFSKDGNLFSYANAWNISESGVVFKTAEEARFTGTLTYDHYSRGRSSALLVFKDSKGHRFQFFMSTFDEIVPLMVNGKIKATFEPCKKGSNCAWKVVHDG